MGAFELNNARDKFKEKEQEQVLGVSESLSQGRVKQECIIALKVYDSCRQQDCLTPTELGPARAAENTCIGDENILESDVIIPPANAASVSVDRLKIKKIIIVDKEPNPFKNGFWDVDLKFVFSYRLTFREADGLTIGSVRANSIFNKRVTLFGSVGAEFVIATDLLRQFGDSTTMEAEPISRRVHKRYARQRLLRKL